MVYNLFSDNGIAVVENQKFTRWNFKLTAYSKKVVIQNQQFVDASTLDLRSKKQNCFK
jgi:hypothetical protein